VKVASPSGDLASTLSEEGADYKVNFTPQQDGPHQVTLTFQVTATVDVNVGSMVCWEDDADGWIPFYFVCLCLYFIVCILVFYVFRLIR
jgi:hypothetical protein